MGRLKRLSTRVPEPGHVYHRLTVVEVLSEIPCQVRFRCECGNEIVYAWWLVLGGQRKSCGCLHRSQGGTSSLPEHKIWDTMLRRCGDPNKKQYKDYGGRGITVCDEWSDHATGFAVFYADMGPRPGPEYSIDRIDNDGPYCKSNCRWATRAVQRRNSRRIRVIEYCGERMCLQDWAAKLGVSRELLRDRILRRGWSVERAFTTPISGSQ